MRPRVLIIVFSKHCVDQLQTDVFVRAQTVVRKEQGDDAAEDQDGDALAIGDVHQVQDYECTVTEERVAEQKVQRAFGANLLHAASVRMSVKRRLVRLARHSLHTSSAPL